MILNSQEELNISTEAIKANAQDNCGTGPNSVTQVLIGGTSSSSRNWQMFSVPSYYIPNNGGKPKVIVTIQ